MSDWHFMPTQPTFFNRKQSYASVGMIGQALTETS